MATEMYRVIVHNPKRKGMASAFCRFSSVLKAEEWAKEYGISLLADSVEFAVKLRSVYNHYQTLKIINL